jgi:hypothetical protein
MNKKPIENSFSESEITTFISKRRRRGHWITVTSSTEDYRDEAYQYLIKTLKKISFEKWILSTNKLPQTVEMISMETEIPWAKSVLKIVPKKNLNPFETGVKNEMV